MNNGFIIDYHGVEFYDFPDNILAIIVVTADTKLLKQRYVKRYKLYYIYF